MNLHDRSFRSRILATFSVLFAVVVITQGALVLSRFNEQAHDLESDRVHGLSTVVAAACGAALDFEDPELLHERLTLLGTDETARAAVALGPGGDVQATWGEPPEPLEAPPLHGVVEHGGHLRVSARIPTRSGRDGELVVWYSHAEQDRIEQANRQFILLVTAIAFLAALGLGTVVAVWVIRPVRALADQARAVSDGTADLHALARSAEQASGYRNDELRLLQAALGHMAGTVQQQLDALEQARADAEQAHQEALQASRAKSRFLANMSHELRTPLNGIVGYAEMINEELDDLSPDEVRHDLSRIEGASRHLLRLISDILDLSKIEAGQMTTYVEDVALVPFVDSLADAIRPVAAQRGNLLVVECDRSMPPQMRTDVTKLRQCLLNLLANAAKFTSDGRVALHVTSLGRGTVCFEVGDTGIGMDAEQLSRVFDEFTQADESTTRRFGGTGLGLSLVRRLVDLLGGTLKVTSAPGVGTTFLVYLPVDLERVSGETPQPRPSSPSRRSVSKTSTSTGVEVTTRE